MWATVSFCAEIFINKLSNCFFLPILEAIEYWHHCPSANAWGFLRHGRPRPPGFYDRNVGEWKISRIFHPFYNESFRILSCSFGPISMIFQLIIMSLYAFYLISIWLFLGACFTCHWLNSTRQGMSLAFIEACNSHLGPPETAAEICNRNPCWNKNVVKVFCVFFCIVEVCRFCCNVNEEVGTYFSDLCLDKRPNQMTTLQCTPILMIGLLLYLLIVLELTTGPRMTKYDNGRMVWFSRNKIRMRLFLGYCYTTKLLVLSCVFHTFCMHNNPTKNQAYCD